MNAGHGGFDGGAVASDGTLEKDLNLSIAKQLQTELINDGYSVIMTRTDNNSLAQNKKDDMNIRLQSMQENRDALFVSIHCNKFSSSSANGLQVFYTTNTDGSALLAQRIQTAYKIRLNQNCNREPKPAGKSIYLLYHAPTDAVLVECGFLSNKAELELLCSDSYQASLADMIADSINHYYEAEN